MIRVGTIFAGRYGIIEKIGSGGMADVYRATDRVTGDEVAIKALKSSLALQEENVERFREEGEAASRLKHENIVAVYDVGEAGGTYYIAMEYVEGVTLKDYIRRKGMLSPRETIAIAAQAAVGLRHAHANHLVHRDIKPQNLILSKDGKVKIADFGIAKDIGEEVRSLRNGTVGSVYYIAPEQVKGRAVDERSDIYSLGICMYEAITGRVPFDKETTMAVALAHMNESMTPPSDLNPECPVALEQIIFRCTQKAKERRYRNCTELLQDLKIAVQDPNYNFEKKDQEKLLRSNTQVFTAEETQKSRNQSHVTAAAATAVSASQAKRSEAAQDIGHRADSPKDTGTEMKRRADGAAEADERETRHASPAKKKKKQLKKTTFDHVLTGVSFALLALMIVLIIYILSKFTSCAPKTDPTKPNPVIPAESTEEVIPTVETKDANEFDPETDTKVPNLLGMSLSEAMKALEDADLTVFLSSEEIYSEEFPLGTVVKQTYPEGAIVPKGTICGIAICSGSDTFVIRQGYVGQNIVVFRRDIAPFTPIIQVNYVPVYSETVAENIIISMSPSQGSVTKGGKITVTYSAGKPYEKVPDLIGMTEEEAKAALEKVGLKLANVDHAYSDEYEAGRVMKQGTKAGTYLRKTSGVNITISDGPELLRVPDLAGMTKTEAEKALNEAGLNYELVPYYSTTETANTVVTQYPAANRAVKATKPVYVYIATTVKSDMVTVPDFVGERFETVKAIFISPAYNLIRSENVVYTDDESLSGLIKSISPEPGTEVERNSTIMITYYKYGESDESSSESESESESASETETEETQPTEPSSSETPTVTESESESETQPETIPEQGTDTENGG